MNRVAPLRKRSPKNTIADERRAKAVARIRVMALNNGMCEVCAMLPATDFAHRLAKSRGGKWQASNGLMTCRPCHQAQRDGLGGERVATALGQVLPSLIDGVAPDPERVPVSCVYGWTYLTDDGDVIPATGAVMMT